MFLEFRELRELRVQDANYRVSPSDPLQHIPEIGILLNPSMKCPQGLHSSGLRAQV